MEGNASNLAELIPHHNHSSLDGLNPVDVMRPSNDKCAPCFPCRTTLFQRPDRYENLVEGNTSVLFTEACCLDKRRDVCCCQL